MRSAPRQFDVVVVIDWSASSRPARGRDSIWIAVHEPGRATPLLENPATRRAAEEILLHVIDSSPGRVLVGLDFPLGYPAGTAAALGLEGPPWRATWELLASMVHDDDRNANDRFQVAAALNRRSGGGPGPFWGRPAALDLGELHPTKPRPADAAIGERLAVAEFRLVEEHLRARGLRPASCWQLLGAGSVGSQALLGIPVLHEVRRRRPDRVTAWPFDTSLGVPSRAEAPDLVLLAEVWPTAFAVDLDRHPVRDAAQVLGVADALLAADAAGELTTWFSPPLDGDDAAAVVAEEGWILGPPPPGPAAPAPR